MTYSKEINNKNIILTNKQSNNDYELNIQNWEPALWCVPEATKSCMVYSLSSYRKILCEFISKNYLGGKNDYMQCFSVVSSVLVKTNERYLAIKKWLNKLLWFYYLSAQLWQLWWLKQHSRKHWNLVLREKSRV